MNVLITGATGDIGSRVTEQLLERGVVPRVFVRRAEKAREIFGDRVDIIEGDLADEASLRAAARGINAVYLVNVGPLIPERDALAASVCKDAGVTKIVKLSSLDVEHGLAIGAWHEEGEAAIRASGVPFTFVRPTGFMTNLLAWAFSIKAEGVVRSSTGDGRRPFIHSDDIAAVSVEALISDEYLGQALSLTGPELLSFDDATAIIGETIGRTLRYEPITDSEAATRYSKVSGSAAETEAHLALWKAIREGRLAAVTNDVEKILQKRPIDLRRWAKENTSSFQ